MARGGRRHPLVIYREVINRWWPDTLIMGLILVGVAWLVYRDPISQFEPWRWKGTLLLGAGTVIFALLLLAMRSMAYVQVFPTHLKLVTPFLRLNISHKRLRRSITTEMRALFPPNKMRGWKRDVIAPLGGRTVVVLELNGWPAAPELLRVFLSPFFFKDKTPHFVILVNDWMRFSTELESLRNGEGTAKPKQSRSINQSILSRLPRKDS
jgi:hypothetical protein